MRDMLAKISIIPLNFNRDAWVWWVGDVWKVDLDQRECCDGYMCGCHGSTYRERHAHYHKAFRFISK
jgi:hypothetical protein